MGLALLVGFSLLALFRGFAAFRQCNDDRDAATLGAALLACMVGALVYVATAGYNETLYILFGLSVSYAVCCRNRVPETQIIHVVDRAKSDELANPVSTSTVNDKFDEHVTVIRPRRGWIAINWRELWEARELLYFLMLRDIKVRYKQTVLGVAWAVLQPVMSMLVFTIIFGQLGEDALGRLSLCDLRVRGAAAVDVLFDCRLDVQPEPSQSASSADQDLPAASVRSFVRDG